MTACSHRRPPGIGLSLVRHRLVIAGLGHVGLAVARDAAVAGVPTICFGAEPGHVLGLIDGLASDDYAIELGDLRITDDVRECSGFDIAVVAPHMRPVVDPAEIGSLEQLAVALAPHMRPGGLVVIAGTSRPRADGELLCGIVELLSGMRAGQDFDLGYALAGSASPTRSSPTIVSGIDDRSARRTAALYRSMGRLAMAVIPAEAGEHVAMLQVALVRRRRPGPEGTWVNVAMGRRVAPDWQWCSARRM